MADELRLSIEKLIYGGDGLAHADGNTVFVPYVLPGEEVRANAKSRKKKLIWAELLEVTSPAEERGKAKCAHFQKCGGCHYQHIRAAEQLRLKKEICGKLFHGWAASRGMARLWSIPRSHMVIATGRRGRCAAECRGRWDIFYRRAL